MKRIIVTFVVVVGIVISPRLWADDTAEQIRSLREQIEVLSEKVRVLEQQTKLESEAAAKTKEASKIIASGSGLSVSSPDTNFVFQLHGLLQVDNRTFFNDNGIRRNDGFLLRRARPIFSGTLYHDFDFLLVPDFAGSSAQIFDAYLNYRFRPWLQLRAGKFKPPVGLEQLQSDPVTSFNERAFPSALAPGRDIGFQIWGDFLDARLSYALGIFNGVGDARNTANSDFEDHRELAARIFAQPFKTSDLAGLQGIGFGVGGSWGNISSNATGLPSTTGGTLPGYVTDGQEQFFAYNPTNGTVVARGAHWRISPQAYYYWGPFSLLGEYIISSQRVGKGSTTTTLESTAWQVSSGWVLTGEKASYAGLVPNHPFDLKAGHWGAFQLVARYAELDIDNNAFPVYANPAASASGAQSWAVGLNWYLNKNLRMNTSFSRTTFDGRGSGATAPGAVTHQPEEVLFTRVQLAF